MQKQTNKQTHTKILILNLHTVKTMFSKIILNNIGWKNHFRSTTLA